MLMCNETITVVHLEKKDDGEEYACKVINGVSWYGKRVMNQSTKGAEPQDTYTVRIPFECVPPELPEKGDFVIRGIYADQIKRAPADFSEREYFCVTSVEDNRRGRMKHIVVSGS